jgi:hypothetical protein
MSVKTIGWRLSCCGLLIALVCSPSLADIRLPFIYSPATVVRRSMALGDWTLQIATGRFSGKKSCHLEDRKHHVSYSAGALGFRFGRHVNTLGAWVKIDDGAATRWQDDLPELTRLGVPMDGSGIDNPTDATVWIPARLLAEANHVAIQPAERRQPVTFHLHGFAALRDAAYNMGCTPKRFAL